MKKLVVFTVAIIAAVMSQAASLDWKVSLTAEETGGNVYMLLGSPAVTDWESSSAIADASISSAAVKSNRGTYYGQATATNVALTKDNANFYFVVVNSTGDQFAVTEVFNGASMVYDAAAQESSPGTLTQTAGTLTYKSFGGNPPPGPTPGDTPEPTSGLLLLVGGAALALRRKQK